MSTTHIALALWVATGGAGFTVGWAALASTRRRLQGPGTEVTRRPSTVGFG